MKSKLQGTVRKFGVAVLAMVFVLPPMLPATLVQAATATIFEDGFEEGNLPGSAWTSADNKWHVQGGDTHAGAKRATVEGDSANRISQLVKNISTASYENISLSFYYKTPGNGFEAENNDMVTVEWTIDGVVWNTLLTLTEDDDAESWTLKAGNLPSDASGAENFAFRFTADLNSGSDKFYLDDVSLSGDTLLPEEATLTVNKVLINDDGGTVTDIAEFDLFVDATQVTSGQTVTLSPGTYVVSEANADGYTATFSGDCDSTGNVTLVAGDDKTCTITNNDTAPEPEPTGNLTIHITKYVCPSGADVSEEANGPDNDGNFVIPEDCIASGGFDFGYKYTSNDGAVVAMGTTNANGKVWKTGLSESEGYEVYELDEAGNIISGAPLIGLFCNRLGDDTVAPPAGGPPMASSTGAFISGPMFPPAASSTDSLSDDGIEIMKCIAYNLEVTDEPTANNAPVISLLGANPLVVTEGDVYVEPGYTAVDAEDGDLHASVVVTGVVDMDTVGSYELAYAVTDSSSLSASVTRTVTVIAQETTTPPDNENVGTGGSVIHPSFLSNTTAPTDQEGEVLGATTDEESCPVSYLSTFLKFGGKNDPEEVRKLQIFLNETINARLPVTGFFGPLTLEAVKKFQVLHAAAILRPWVEQGLWHSEEEGTGYVYLTTRRWINALKCPTSLEPLPPLM